MGCCRKSDCQTFCVSYHGHVQVFAWAFALPVRAWSCASWSTLVSEACTHRFLSLVLCFRVLCSCVPMSQVLWLGIFYARLQAELSSPFFLGFVDRFTNTRKRIDTLSSCWYLWVNVFPWESCECEAFISWVWLKVLDLLERPRGHWESGVKSRWCLTLKELPWPLRLPAPFTIADACWIFCCSSLLSSSSFWSNQLKLRAGRSDIGQKSKSGSDHSKGAFSSDAILALDLWGSPHVCTCESLDWKVIGTNRENGPWRN